MNRKMSRRRTALIVAACGLIAILGVLVWKWDREGSSDPSANVELCGYGKTHPIRQTDDYPPEVVKAADRAFTSVADDLSTRAQPTPRAVGLYAKLVTDMRRAGEREERANPNCVDEQCVQRRLKLAREAASPRAQELAQLASASQDAGAYSMGLFGCRLNREDGACAKLSIARWSELDADNAVPWSYLAEEAASRKDEVALSQALKRAANAQTSDYRGSTILVMAEHPIARQLAAAPRLVYLTHLLGIYAALPTPPHRAVSKACVADRMENSTRKQVCGELATMMTERSKSNHEFGLGTSIGERAGWPPDRVQRLRDEKEAVYFVEGKDWVPEDVHSCRFLEQLETRTRELSSIGELSSARQKIAASGRPVSELARDWRELQRQRSEASDGKAASK
jgi:hypothetical protein